MLILYMVPLVAIIAVMWIRSIERTTPKRKAVQRRFTPTGEVAPRKWWQFGRR